VYVMSRCTHSESWSRTSRIQLQNEFRSGAFRVAIQAMMSWDLQKEWRRCLRLRCIATRSRTRYISQGNNDSVELYRLEADILASSYICQFETIRS
jgi:hypothetical protein